MTPLRSTGSPKFRLALLALLTVTTLLMPPVAKAAERDGTVLFFSLEEIQHVLAHPSLPALASLLSFSQPASSFAWRMQSEAAEQDSRWSGMLATVPGWRLRGIASRAPTPCGDIEKQ